MPSPFLILRYVMLIIALAITLLLVPGAVFPAIYALNSSLMLVILPLTVIMWVMMIYVLLSSIVKLAQSTLNPTQDK